MRLTLALAVVVATSQPVIAQVEPPRINSAEATAGMRKNNVLSAVEVGGFLVVLNMFDRLVFTKEIADDGKPNFATDWESISSHFRRQHWVFDKDPFNTNQFGHPYEGSMMFGLARSSGHGFWTSLVHSNVGSFVWEMAGERQDPSINDLVTTGQAGAMLGEALFRMSSLILRDPNRAPVWWRELGAALIAPPNGVNRRIYGGRFDPNAADVAPGTSWRFRMGATREAVASDARSPLLALEQDAILEYTMSYGMPGTKDYMYRHPFDHFDFQVTLTPTRPKNVIENVYVRGLLFGSDVSMGERYSGVWGAYANYDYVSPRLFRVSNTALSLGTTGQLTLSPDAALQGTASAGIGFGAAGTVTSAADTNAAGEQVRDYHFGATPEGLLALKLILGNTIMLDATGREYYVTGWGSDDNRGTETIFRGSAGITARIYGPHGVSIQWVHSMRDAAYRSQDARKITQGTVSVAYTLVGGTSFGKVK